MYIMDNYFELYGIPPTLRPPQAAVKAKFYDLSRTYHPDRFAQADQAKKLEALSMAVLNNKAYKTLSDADATVAYVLRLEGMLEDEEKYNLPPDFLMEMMDINEEISEYELNPADDALRNRVEKRLDEFFALLKTKADVLAVHFDKGQRSKEILMQIKDMYFRKKYLLRIEDRIDKFAPR